MLLGAVIAVFSGMILTGGLAGFESLILPKVPALLILETVIFSSLYLLYFVLQKLAGPVYLSQIGSVAAILGTFLAVIVLGETMPKSIVPVALLIGAGILLFQSKSRP